MKISTIEVGRRTAKGRHKMAKLRQEGMVPAVLYGGGGESINLAVSEREVQRHVRQHHKVFKLAMEGRQQAIFLQEVQWDCLTDRPLHLDFVRIDLNKPLHVTVEIAYLGHPVGISKGSRLVKDLTDLKVACLPEAIPEIIELRVAHLDMGDIILAKDIELPEGVTLDMPEDTSICHLPGADELAFEAAAEAAEAAEAEEGLEPGVAAPATPEGDDAGGS